MWVIFEGLDKAGKTTLEWEFLKATNFKHIVVDRGPVGYKVFDELFGRNNKLSEQEFIHQARKMMKNKDFMVVYLKCDAEVAEARIEVEDNEVCPYDYKKAQKLYDKEVHRYYKSDRVLEIDTTDVKIEKCVQSILEKLEDINYELQ